MAASTYSTRLRLELIPIGEQGGTWGTTTNTNLGTLLEEALAGVISVTHDDGATDTLTTANGGTDEARQMVILIAGAITQARIMECPQQEKLYIVKNGTSGGFACTFQPTGGSGISIPNGETMFLYCDGTDIVSSVSHLPSLTLASALTVAQGGTGAATFTDGGILLGSGTGAITALAALADGEMIVGDGTTDPAIESGATLRSSIGVDAAGMDNSTNVTLAGTPNYLTLSGQEITLTKLDLDADTNFTAGAGIALSTNTVSVDGVLQDLDTLGVVAGDGRFIVGSGAGAFAYETGVTVSDSILASLRKFTYSGQIDVPTNKDYIIELKAPFAFDVLGMTHQLSAGSITGDLQIDATSITSMDAMSITTSEVETTQGGLNSVAADETLTLTFTSASSVGDLYFTIECTKTA